MERIRPPGLGGSTMMHSLLVFAGVGVEVAPFLRELIDARGNANNLDVVLLSATRGGAGYQAPADERMDTQSAGTGGRMSPTLAPTPVTPVTPLRGASRGGGGGSSRDGGACCCC